MLLKHAAMFLLPAMTLAAPIEERGEQDECAVPTPPTSTISSSPPTSTVLSSPTSPPVATPFIVTSLRSASPIHFGSVVASGGNFWIGKSTASYCPSEVLNCPAGNLTALIVTNGECSLDVEVSGGQQVYVENNGLLSYTLPNSAYIPPGSVVTGFYETFNGNFDTFGFIGLNSPMFTACPAEPSTPPWLIFASTTNLTNSDVPSGNVSDCLGFDTITEPFKGGFAAWEYT